MSPSRRPGANPWNRRCVPRPGPKRPADVSTIGRRQPGYPPPVPERLPAPGPSFLRAEPVRIGSQTFQGGMTRPSDAPDGWWLAVLWVSDGTEVVSFRDVAPDAGPPPDPPLARLGPADQRRIVGPDPGGRWPAAASARHRSLRPTTPPDRGARPLAVRAAFRFEPARAAAMRPNELAETVLSAFCRAVEGLHRP